MHRLADQAVRRREIALESDAKAMLEVDQGLIDSHQSMFVNYVSLKFSLVFVGSQVYENTRLKDLHAPNDRAGNGMK